MNIRLVRHFICVLLTLIGCAITGTGLISFFFHDPATAWKITGTGIAISVFFALAAQYKKPKTAAEKYMGLREGFAVVGLGWLSVSLIGALPYIAVCRSAGTMSICDAVFETASGFSTTGATILNDVEALPRGILFWRSLTHWLGGMGIVVLTMAILPLLHINGQSLYNAEVTGMKSSDTKLAPRIASGAKLLWAAYIFLTAAEVMLLWLGPMNFFDAVCHSFSTIATGGFSTKNSSIAYYNSAYTDYVIIFFMFISSCNFALLVNALFHGKWSGFWKDEECRHFFFFLLAATVITTIILTFIPSITNRDYLEYYEMNSSGTDSFMNMYPDFLKNPVKSFRYALFQVVSIISTTGFSTADYQLWPFGAQMVLFVLMFIGGCSGSTSGGLKFVRIQIAAKRALLEIKRAIFPHLVPAIRISNERIEQETVYKIGAFLALFFTTFLIIAGILILFSLDSEQMDFTTALSASISCLSNVGPGFGNIGPANTYGWMTAPAKLLLSFAMILGRLELYTILVLFLPSLWKK